MDDKGPTKNKGGVSTEIKGTKGGTELWKRRERCCFSSFNVFFPLLDENRVHKVGGSCERARSLSEKSLHQGAHRGFVPSVLWCHRLNRREGSGVAQPKDSFLFQSITAPWGRVLGWSRNFLEEPACDTYNLENSKAAQTGKKAKGH